MTILLDDAKYNVEQIPTEEIYHDDSFNCRGFIAPHSCIELSKSINERGLDQPILVQPYDKIPGKKYRIVAGHRRYVAMQILKWTHIPCFIKYNLSEREARTQNLVENIHRQDLNILQEAKSLEWFFAAGIKRSDVAMYLNMSTTWVEAREALLRLPEDIQQYAAAGFMTQNQIKEAARFKNTDEMYEFIRKIKDAKARGEKFKVIKKITNKKETFSARERKKDEIEQVIAMMMEVWEDGNLCTRFGAWCAGNINTIDLMNDIQRAASEDGLIFQIPIEITQGLLV